MASTILKKLQQKTQQNKNNSGADMNILLKNFSDQINKSGQDPNTILNSLLKSGKVSQKQLNEAIEKARAFQNKK